MKLTDYKQCQSIQCVYKIHNTKTKQVYIGSTINLRRRIRRHGYELRTQTHHSSKLQRAVNKYGIEIFYVEIIYSETITLSELHAKEIEYIKKFNSVNKGYNQILNSKEYKKFKQSSLAKENFIKSRSIKVISIDLKTKKVIHYSSVAEAALKNKEQSTNISKCCKNKLRYIKNKVFIYEKNYDSTIDYTQLRKIDYGHTSAGNIQRAKANPLSRKVYKFDLDNNLIEEYHSISYCEKMNNIKKDGLKYKILKRTPIRGHLYLYNENNI